MSDATVELLSRLRGRGIKLSAEGGQLRFDAPTGSMTPALRAEIARQKPELLHLLRSTPWGGAATQTAIAPVPRADRMPLSHDEQRLWFLHHALPDPSTYNVAAATRLRGPLDRKRLKEAFTVVMRRHEILRTGFVEHAGSPVRLIADDLPLPLVIEDLPSVAGDSTEAQLQRRLAEELKRPFILAAPPLYRLSCLRLGDDDHALVLVAHHIICDDWSVQLWWNEVQTAYAAGTGPEPRELPDLPVQYADYAGWQCRRVADAAMEPHRAYWRNQLRDAPTTLALPYDRIHPPQPSHRGGVSTFLLARSTADALEQLGTAHQATPFMTWLTAFAVFLSRLSGQQDFLVGAPLARRERPEVQPLIGFFLNTLPLRMKPTGAASFRELLQHTRTIMVQAFEHGDLPLDQIRLEAPPAQTALGSSLFAVMLILRNDQQRAWTLPGTIGEELPVSMGTAKAELSLFLDRLDDRRLRGTFEYSLDGFTTAAIDRTIGQWQCLLEAMIRSPDAPVAALPLLPADQRRQVVHDFNPAPLPYERETTVHALFEQRARETPDAVALILGREQVGYRELDQRANQLARHLRGLGVEPGSFVALLLDRSIEFVVSVLAVLKLGAAYVPLNPEFPAERLRFMLEDTAARVLITQGGPALAVDGTHGLDLVKDRAAIANCGRENPGTHGTADDAAYVIYTSGSTGRPKGVVVPHRGIVRLVRGQTFVPFGPDERFLLLCSPTFDVSTFELWGPLLNGATCVIFPDRWPDFEELEKVIREHGVTCLWLTTGLFNQIIDQRPSVPATVRHLLVGGEALSVSHVRRALERLPHVRLVNGYGPTECTTFASTYAIPPDGSWPASSVPIGRPIAHTSAYVLNAHREPVPIGVAGELYLGGDGVALGYLKRPELTAERFVQDPFGREDGAKLYRTGDRARWLPDGTIEFLGRMDDQIKLRGFRVELGEIESALGDHPDVTQAAVTLQAGLNGEKELQAWLLPHNGSVLSAETLRAFLHQRLPDYMVPSRFAVIDHLPLNASGKVDRAALLQANQRDLVQATEHVAPRTDAERRLVGIWERILQRERVGIHDNFFRIGGSSLMAMRLMHEIRESFERSVPLAALFAAPTIAELAIRLDGLEASGPSVGPQRLRGSGPGTPLFHIPEICGFGFLPPEVTKRLSGERPYFDGFQFRGLDGRQVPADTIEQIAADLITQLRAVRPHGPYGLSGFCVGGLVAYEMARQLEAAGEIVAGVSMWDSTPAHGLRRCTGREAIRIIRERLARETLHGWTMFIGIRLKHVAHRAGAGWTHLKSLFGFRTPEPTIEQRVQAAASRAGTDYRPVPYRGRVMRVRTPSDRLFSIPVPGDGWGDALAGAVETVDFKCSHFELLKEPAVLHLAEKTAEFLRAADRKIARR